MSNHNEKVKKYFNQISEDYVTRSEKQNRYHAYFFNERLELATKDFDFNQKNILDIGAGIGGLYDFLRKKHPSTYFEYCATDIAQGMLQQSKIPDNQQFTGKINEIELPKQEFDFIFLLGVTTYFSEKDWLVHLNFIQQNLSPTGKAIISFTNKNSLDFRFRNLIKPIFRLFKKEVLLSQDFSISAFSPSQFTNNFPSNFKITSTHFFNFIISPFNQIFPKIYIAFANWLKKKRLSPTLQSYLAADFLVVIEKEA